MFHSMASSQSNETSHGKDAEPSVDFGFRRVPENEKAGLVKEVFDTVASRYDLMNDLMSLGIHRLWKASLLDWLAPKADMCLLDVGGGTGDIATGFLKRGGGAATVCDINTEMVVCGRNRAIDRGFVDDITWITGNAEYLPVADSSVDAYVTAFCIRNVTHIDAALKEARRVLKPGGHFLCLEFSRIAVPALEGIYDAYSFRVLPPLGGLITGNRDAYRYLAESIRNFPAQDKFSDMISNAGLEQVTYRNLSAGIAAIHSAWRI